MWSVYTKSFIDKQYRKIHLKMFIFRIKFTNKILNNTENRESPYLSPLVTFTGRYDVVFDILTFIFIRLRLDSMRLTIFQRESNLINYID